MLSESNELRKEKGEIMTRISRDKAFLAVTVFIVLISFAKNVQSIIQLINDKAPTAIWNDKVGFITGAVFFLIGASLIRNKWWRIGWSMIILNELLIFSVTNVLSEKVGILPMFAISVGTILLCLSGYSFLKYKRTL